MPERDSSLTRTPFTSALCRYMTAMEIVKKCSSLATESASMPLQLGGCALSGGGAAMSAWMRPMVVSSSSSRG